MIEILQSIGNAITTFISQISTFFSYVGQFFTLVSNMFTIFHTLLVNMVPSWVAVFGIATLFVAIIWIIIEII